MIFAMPEEHETLFMLLANHDIATMRSGRTLFIDEQMLQGRKFVKVVLSLGKTDEENVKLVQRAMKIGNQPVNPPTGPGQGEMRCAKCLSIVDVAGWHDGKCIVCWCEEAKRLRKESN